MTAALSYDFSRGTYGGSDVIRTWSTNASVEVDRGDFNVSMNFPIVRQFGPVGEVIVAGRPLIVHGKPVVRNGKVVVGPSSTHIVEDYSQGLGDVTVSASYFLPNASEGAPLFDIRLQSKLATGNREQGLGSGTIDYTGQFEGSQSFGDVTLAGSIGYTHVGRIEDVHVNDYMSASFDLSRHLTDTVKCGFIWNFAKAAVSGASDAQDLTFYVARDVGKNGRLQAYVLHGIQSGSPAQGAGLSLNLNF